MRTFFIFKKVTPDGILTETVEMLDEYFEVSEGDLITVTEGNSDLTCTVTKIQKIIRREGNNCTAVMKIYITNAD